MPRVRRRLGAIATVVLVVSTLTGIVPSSPASAAAVVYSGAGSAPRIGIIGDSAFAGISVVNAFDPLKTFNFTYDAVTCRRTTLSSCSAGGSTPPNALSTLRQRAGQWGSVLVMTTGYNDPGHQFDEAVDSIMAEAARQGIPTVMWLTLRTAPVGFVPASYESTSWTFRDNNLILLQKAAQYGGRLQIADWAGYTSARGDWFSSDGIHFRTAGAYGAASYITAQARRVLNGETITPTRDGLPPPGALWTHLRYGMGGTVVADLQRLLLAEGIAVRGGIDGYFSIWTVYAVQTFQRMHGIHPNGIVDEATGRALGLLSGSWAAIGVGATGTSVARAQQALINRGIFVRGGATGRFDVWTMYAVKTFQRRQGLRVSGVIDGQTARSLGLLTAPHPSSVWTALSQGSTGVNVARSQRALMDQGVFVRGGATGRFDVYTYYAVQTFQRHNGLRVTGVVDVETARALGLFDLANPVATWIDVALGSAGPMVRRAEQALIGRGVYVRDGVDGVFKLWDYYAVSTFQRHNGLPVTGRINLATAVRLGMFDATTAATTAAPTAPMLAATTAATVPTTTTATSTTTTIAATTTTTTTTIPATTSTSTTTAVGAPADVPIAGLAWIDLDADGIDEAGEPRLAGVVVRLLDANGAVVADDITDHEGRFALIATDGADVRLEADIPVDHTVTAADQLAPGLDAEQADDVDSDFVEVDLDAAVTRTARITVAALGIDNLALGLVPAPTAPTTTATTTTTAVATTTTAVPTTAIPTDPTTTTTTPSTTAPTATAPATTTTAPPASTTSTPTATAVPAVTSPASSSG